MIGIAVPNNVVGTGTGAATGGGIQDRNMNSYQPSKPRAALLAAAVAMTTITMGVLVVLPAQLESVSSTPGPTTAAVVAHASTAEPQR